MAAMMTLAIALAAETPVLGAIGRQQLPATGCAAYLWSASDRALVAMASAEPARLRVTLDGKRLDLPRVAQRGEGGYGLAATTDYRAGDVAATLDLTIAPSAGVSDGAAVPQATLRVTPAGKDELIVPLGGMIGCTKP